MASNLSSVTNVSSKVELETVYMKVLVMWSSDGCSNLSSASSSVVARYEFLDKARIGPLTRNPFQSPGFIPGAPSLLKEPDSKKYVQLSYKPSVAPKPIPKRPSMLDIPKFDRMTDTHEHILDFIMADKGNDLTKDEIESVLVKKFGETL
ncbi:hypothetical protein HAX54_002897 [Datura stramonium]|uniref:Uncharacterized protein n=1 Tax=Datura stramonium TaxID=4076 RepID=A0ABS8T4K2_DATST|nr:hypothetical protein [Datura stramonium]